MALGRFLALLVASYIGFALVVVVSFVGTFAFLVCVWGFGEWVMAPFWEMLFRKLLG